MFSAHVSSRTRLTITAAPLIGALALTGCGSEKQVEEKIDSKTPQEMIVGNEEATSGFQYENLLDMFPPLDEIPKVDEKSSYEPASCAPLIFGPDVMMDWIESSPDDTALAAYTIPGNDESVIYIKLKKASMKVKSYQMSRTVPQLWFHVTQAR